MLRVRDSDTAANSGASEFFSSHDRADDVIAIFFQNLTGIYQGLHEFGNHFFLRRRA
jgi:hypothetical protein